MNRSSHFVFRIRFLFRRAGPVFFLAAFLAACSPPSVQVVERTVVVVVTATPGPDRPSPVSNRVPTATDISTLPTPPENTLAPTAGPTATISPSPQPLPSPTPLILVSVPVEGDHGKIQAEIVYPKYDPAATTDLVFQVRAHNPEVGQKDGAGIDSIDFVISKDGQEVYKRTEKQAGYCAFGGGEPTCNIFNFAKNGYQWPGTAIALQSGTYTLDITIHSASGDAWSGQTTFDIQVP